MPAGEESRKLLQAMVHCGKFERMHADDWHEHATTIAELGYKLVCACIQAFSCKHALHCTQGLVELECPAHLRVQSS